MPVNGWGNLKKNPCGDLQQGVSCLRNQPSEHLPQENKTLIESICYWILCTGRIHFTLDYSFNENCLTVGVVEAQDVPAKDFSGTSDPYARVMLLPDRKKKFDTKVSRIQIFNCFMKRELHKNPCDRTNLTNIPREIPGEVTV